VGNEEREFGNKSAGEKGVGARVKRQGIGGKGTKDCRGRGNKYSDAIRGIIFNVSWKAKGKGRKC